MPGGSVQAAEAQRERHVHALGQAPLQAHGARGHSKHAVGVVSAEVAVHLIHTLITCRYTHTDEKDPHLSFERPQVGCTVMLSVERAVGDCKHTHAWLHDSPWLSTAMGQNGWCA